MVKKLRALHATLRAAGFLPRPGRGSHEVWVDQVHPARRVVLNRKGGKDAPKYQEARVRKYHKGCMVYLNKRSKFYKP